MHWLLHQYALHNLNSSMHHLGLLVYLHLNLHSCIDLIPSLLVAGKVSIEGDQECNLKSINSIPKSKNQRRKNLKLTCKWTFLKVNAIDLWTLFNVTNWLVVGRPTQCLYKEHEKLYNTDCLFVEHKQDWGRY